MIKPPAIESFTSVFLPASEDSLRLVIVLHGLGDSLEGYRWLPGALALSRQSYLLLNGPLAYDGGYAWFDLEAEPEPELLRGRSRLRRLFGELERDGWESGQTLLFGFSQGCVIATDFALRWEKPLAGVIGISGYIFFPDHLEAEIHPRARGQPWLITHGTHDSVLPIARTRAQVRKLKRLGMNIEWIEVRKAHAIDPGDELAAIRGWMVAHGY
jgi:phospholipase/carboxylesterase